MDRPFPKLKFCGLTRREDVAVAIDLGADAIGLNFFPASPRFVGEKWSDSLLESYRGQVESGRLLAVGVFVNWTPHQVAKAIKRFGLNCVQLHGDEDPTWLDQADKLSPFNEVTYLKAVSWGGAEDESIVLDWGLCAHPRLLGLLVDSFDPIQRGGTGKTVRWDLLDPRPAPFSDKKIMLAGGLRPENVQIAITTANPDGLDIASGIELSPGIKDHAAMKAIAESSKNWKPPS